MQTQPVQHPGPVDLVLLDLARLHQACDVQCPATSLLRLGRDIGDLAGQGAVVGGACEGRLACALLGARPHYRLGWACGRESLAGLARVAPAVLARVLFEDGLDAGRDGRLELAVYKVLCALGGAAVEQFFLQVDVGLVAQRCGCLADGLDHSLGIDLFVLQCVDHGVELRFFGRIPRCACSLAGDLAAGKLGVAIVHHKNRLLRRMDHGHIALAATQRVIVGPIVYANCLRISEVVRLHHLSLIVR